MIVLSIPLLALSAVLLALVFKHQVNSDPPLFDIGTDQTIPFIDNKGTSDFAADGNAYYVNYDATRLITVASWSSTVAPLLPGFVLALLSFPIAKQMLDGSTAQRRSQSLTTPYQTSLLLALYGGSIGSLWPTAKYFFWPSREHLSPGTKTAITGLCISSIIGSD